MIGELLKAADRYIKSTEWNKALEEVNKALAIEPNNMYAMAYKDRINVSIAEEKKKAEEEKVKKLSEDKKAGDKPADAVKEKPSEPVKSADQSKPMDAAKKEAVKEESKPAAKEEPAAKAKDDSTTRLETLRQEFAATQAKLQRDVAQLTMQVKEAQALKDAAEKNLNAQIAALQHELSSAKQQTGKGNDKELEAVKKELDSIRSKHQKEIETAKEVAKAESLAQIAVLQKELETVKNAAANASFQKQGEDILRSMFQKSWLDGAISADERVLLLVLKSALQMTDAKFSELETAAKGEAYITALRNVWSDDSVTPNESDFLTTLREKLGIPADEHFKLESQIRKELKK